MVVVDALRESRRARGVDDHQVRGGLDLDRGRLERGPDRADLSVHGREPVVADRERGRVFRVGAQHQDVLGPDGRELRPDALDLGEQALVDDQEAGAGLIDDAGEGLAAEPRVDPEERVAGVRAAEEQRHQLEVVLEQHRHVAGGALAHRLEASAQEVGGPQGFVTQLTIRPRPVVLHEEDLGAADLVRGARLELGADGERSHEL
mgnify:CR=1 FL=1